MKIVIQRVLGAQVEVGGEVKVTNNGDGTCVFDISLQDGYGHRVSGSCTVPCRVEDWS